MHVIANLRGTGGAGGPSAASTGRNAGDMYDLVEWAAEQSRCDGNVGMIGISYFATRSRPLPASRFPSSTNQTEG